ncbi:MAG TPA: putative Ig domain-containing protein [archaeon]|nr:putative Ig domain-containing protein [archaeon]
MVEVTLPDSAAKQLRVLVDNETQILAEDGSPVTLSDLKAGDNVQGEGDPAPDGSFKAKKIQLAMPPPSQISIFGVVIEVGADYLLVGRPGEDSMRLETTRVAVTGETDIFDKEEQPSALSDLQFGDGVQVDFTIGDDSTLSAVKVVIKDKFPRPGEQIQFTGKIVSTDGSTILVSAISPERPAIELRVSILSGTVIRSLDGLELALGDLSAGDILDVQGLISKDQQGILVAAIKITYSQGSFLKLRGKVIAVREGGFDLETRSPDQKVFVLQVILDVATKILREDTREPLSKDAIVKNISVGVEGKILEGNRMQAKSVLVPPPACSLFQGRVVSIEDSVFVIETKRPEENIFIKVRIQTGGFTSWFTDDNRGNIEPADAAQLGVDDFVRVAGISTEVLTAKADTVWIVATEDLAVMEFPILEGQVAGSVFTFKIEIPGPSPDEPPAKAEGRLDISPDFKRLAGKLVIQNEPDKPKSIVLSKVQGEANKLTGLWSGVWTEEDGTGGPITADLIQAGAAVTGRLVRSGAVEPGEGPQVGDQTTLRGEVTNISGNVMLVTFPNELNQLVSKPVLVLQGVKIEDIQGNILQVPVDSLFNLKVAVTGVIQADLSLLASRIVLERSITGLEPSAVLPIIASGKWDLSTRTVTFALEAKYFDEQATGLVTFNTRLSQDGSSLSGEGAAENLTNSSLSASSSAYKADLKRVSGAPDSPSGAWTGGVSAEISGLTKIWPLFLDLKLQDGSLVGNYEIGEGRFKAAEIVTQNRPPLIAEFGEITAKEGEKISIPVSAEDPEGDAITLSISGLPIPGSSFTDNGNGTGTYTLIVPRLSPGKEELIVTIVAVDSKGAGISRVLRIKVQRVNQPPVIGEIPQPLILREGAPFAFTIPAKDPDGERLTFEVQGLPAKAVLVQNVISYTPPFGSAGEYTVTVTVKDPGGEKASKTFSIKVEGVNRPPRFIKPPLIEGQPGAPITLTLQAVDPDPGDVLTYSVLVISNEQVLPKGAIFDPSTAQLNWTPTSNQVGPFKAGFVVSDSKNARDMVLVNFFIGQGHLPPSLQVLDSTAVNQGERLEFTASGQSSDNRPLRFYARGLPRGAAFDPNSKTFKWTPDYFQQGNYKVVLGVGDGSFRTEKDVTITVNPVKLTPVIEKPADYSVEEGKLLSFRVFGYYPNGRRVVFDKPGSLPANSAFDPVTGMFRFLPGYEQAGAYGLTFSVTGEDGTVSSVSNTVTVLNLNRPPKLARLSNVLTQVNGSVSFQVQATDPDSNDVLTYSAVKLPEGAAFDHTADPPAFSWTPGAEGNFSVTFTVSDASQASDRRTVYITVGTANQPPVLGEIGKLTISEGDTLNLTVSASDPEGDQVAVFVNPLPENASFDNNNNTFTFQPAFDQAGTYYLNFVASDGELTDEEQVGIEVLDVSLPPTISVTASWSIQEGDTLDFTVQARDITGVQLEVISSSLPDGADLDEASGKFFWSPDYDQAGEYQVTFIASDGAQSAQKDVVITVTDRNRSPKIFEIADQEVKEGELISFEITTTDLDGDPVTIAIDSTETPYIESVDIRNNSVFVFNTDLLPKEIQIPSAVFTVTADDGRGGTDRRSIAFKIIREAEVDVPSIEPSAILSAASFDYQFPGTGLRVNITNKGASAVSGSITGIEVSGTPGTGEQAAGAQLVSARYPYLSKSKDKVVVQTFLCGDGSSGGDFYGIRRGWGFDLTALQTDLTTLKFDITLTYEDRDIPARDILEFTESALSMFGLVLDADGDFVQPPVMLPTTLDTVANTAAAEVDLSLYTDITLGVILDLAAPEISGTAQLENTTDELGPYKVTAAIVDKTLRSAKLYYALEGQQFTPVNMTLVPGKINQYTASIPGQTEGSSVVYYIEAGDSLHTVTDPLNAPQNTYRFAILIDGVESVRSGDMNNNGNVDIFDLLEMLKTLGGSSQATGVSDVDGSGKTDIFDLLELLKILAE